jgi:tetratricopeptide (TPR) repeat protein
LQPVSRAAVQASHTSGFPRHTLRRAKPQPARSMVEDAEALINAKRQFEALGLLRNVPLGHPDIRKATSLTIRAYCETGQMERAEGVFSFALENGILAQEGCSMLFLACVQKDHESAERLFARVLESEVPASVAYNAMIYALAQCGNYIRVSSLLDEAEGKGAADAHTYGLAIALRLRIRDFEGARELFSRALHTGHANEAMCLKIVGLCKRQDAKTAALDILRTAAGQGLCSERLRSETEALEGKKAAGVPGIKDRVLGGRSEQARNCNGRIAYYLESGEVEPARRIFDESVGQNLIDAPVYLLMMNAYLEAGDMYNARYAFYFAVKNSRADERIFCAMASAYLERDMYAEACGVVAQAHETASSCADFYDSLFNGVYAAKRFHTILYFIDHLPQQIRDAPPLVLWTITVLRKMRRYGKAVSMADSLLERPGLEREYAQRARINKAYALAYSGKPGAAFGILNAVLKEMSPEQNHYCKALCGLAFAYAADPKSVVFPAVEREALLEKIEPLRGTRNPSTNRELEAARGYILESLKG